MRKIKFALLALAIGSFFSLYLTSCSEDNEVIQICGCMDETAVNYNPDANCDDNSCILPSQLDDTTRVIYSATAHGADNSKTPYVDKAHSSVRWETDYSDLGFSLLTGRFAQFDVDITFNEKDPSKTKIDGWVQLSSQLTGEPGRDAPGKCGPGYHGVEWYTHEEINGTDTVTVYDSTITSTDYAYLTVDGAEFYFNSSKRGFTTSYKGTGTLDYRGETSTVDVYFNYNGLDYEAGRSGFEGYFEFNAISDHGVTSTSIADKVTVLINVQVRGI